LSPYLVTDKENSEYRGKPEMVIPKHKPLVEGKALTTYKEHPEMDGDKVWTATNKEVAEETEMVSRPLIRFSKGYKSNRLDENGLSRDRTFSPLKYQRRYLAMDNENSEYRGKPEMVIPRHLKAVTTSKELPFLRKVVKSELQLNEAAEETEMISRLCFGSISSKATVCGYNCFMEPRNFSHRKSLSL
jgi:hypothetical protein